MRIRCDRCSTVYELDASRLPPGGAAVQCTRCRHVFTARPDQPGQAAPPATHAPPVASATPAPAAGEGHRPAHPRPHPSPLADDRLREAATRPEAPPETARKPAAVRNTVIAVVVLLVVGAVAWLVLRGGAGG